MLSKELTSTIEIDGNVYDSDTGEHLGVVGKPEFHVIDQASAEWVLEKMAALDSDILAIEARLKALSENLGVMKAEKERNRAGLLYKFGPELEHFAKENLPNGKKTWTCPYGSVSFRSTSGGLRVKDKDAALEIATMQGWTNTIKVTEEFQISRLDPAQRELAESCLGSNPSGKVGVGWAEAFTITEPTETSTIKTGV